MIRTARIITIEEPGTRDNTIDANVVKRNGRDGIHVTEGAVGNRLTGNVGSDNGVLTLAGFDGYDGNLNCATTSGGQTTSPRPTSPASRLPDAAATPTPAVRSPVAP